MATSFDRFITAAIQDSLQPKHFSWKARLLCQINRKLQRRKKAKAFLICKLWFFVSGQSKRLNFPKAHQCRNYVPPPPHYVQVKFVSIVEPLHVSTVEWDQLNSCCFGFDPFKGNFAANTFHRKYSEKLTRKVFKVRLGLQCALSSMNQGTKKKAVKPSVHGENV